MPRANSELASLQLPQLAALATSAWPAWLWSTDASRILWTNAVGAAIFGTAHVSEISKCRFSASDPASAHITRLAVTLPAGGQERLELLRGFGASFGRALMCSCARLAMPDNTPAILVAAVEPAGPSLTLADRIRRLLPDGPEALAAFAPDGALLFANSAALSQLGSTTTLSALGIEPLAASALEEGEVSGVARLGQTQSAVTLTRLGKNATRVLLLALSSPQLKSGLAEESTPPDLKSVPAPEISQPTTTATVGGEPPSVHSPGAPDREAAEERRHPLRFVWQMDVEGRFAVGSDEFIELVGARTFASCGRLWSEIAAELNLDPDNQVARAVATRETWSGISTLWPVDETNERLPVELSALPVFDRDRVFRGYRGFGVCRDVDRLNQLARARRGRPIGFTPAPSPTAGTGGEGAANGAPMSTTVAPPLPGAAHEAGEPAAEPAPQSGRPAAEAPAADNVVPFRPGAAAETRPPSLSPVERSAFRELAQELTARLRGIQEDALVVSDEQYAAAELSAPASIAAAAAQVATELPPIAPALHADVPNPMPKPLATDCLLDRVPAGILVYRGDVLLYANRYFLELSGYDDVAALGAAGGLNALFAEPRTDTPASGTGTEKLSITTRGGDKLAIEGRLLTVPWDAASALALVLTGTEAQALRTAQAALTAAQNEIRDLKSNLDRIARREVQKAAAAKADFLAKVSHEIRTPLNSMIGFAEVIMAERFGSIGNERYREYLKDMHAAGTHIVSMLNDLLDLFKIETGQLALTFADVDLNDLTQQCVGLMQPQASRARIIIRTALTPGLLHVIADARSLRQIVINLLANAIKFTGPGGQVIVSTAIGDAGEALLRVRDTGAGMRETDIEATLNPFQQNAPPAGWGSGSVGLGLPLTKALAEANRAKFNIRSAPNSGTLIEIIFPRGHIAAP